jgi:hydroxyacyl-ACP dehydratase HTD2-like protein with hotdog domain
VVGGSEWEYHTRVEIGDRLRGRRVVAEVQEKPGARGTMTILTLETRFHRADGALAVIQRDTVIELPR